MEFVSSDEQTMLRDTVRSLLAGRATSARVREVMESATGCDDELWDALAELGLTAMHIPEEFGGAGYTFAELGIVQEELGRVVAPVPYLATVGLGASTVILAGSAQQQQDVLPGVAGGTTKMALAVLEDGRSWEASDIATEVTPDGGDLILRGAKSWVVDGMAADLLIVSAREASGVSLFLVDVATDHLDRRRLTTMDMTRPQAAIEFHDVRIAESARIGPAGSGVATLESIYEIGATLLAYEQVGGAQRCMEMAVDYAKERLQFGRPIGSFQAIKHKCADMLIQLESARSAAYHAGWAASHDMDELMVAAPTAKVACSEAYFFCAAENIQVHGGIGFTWEHDAHLYFKRATTSQLLFGDPAEWRRKLASRLGV